MRSPTQKQIAKITQEKLNDSSVEELCGMLEVAFYGEDMQGTDDEQVRRVLAALVPACLLSSF